MLSRAHLLKLQMKHVGGVPASELLFEARMCHLVRQLSVCKRAAGR